MNPLTILTLIESGLAIVESVIGNLINSGILPKTSNVPPTVAMAKKAVSDAKATVAKSQTQ